MIATGPKVAIVHDALVTFGGAERLASHMCEAFPDAPVFTSVYIPDMTYPAFRTRSIHTLPGSKTVTSEKRMKMLLPLWVLGFRFLDLSKFDIVLSSTTYAAKFINDNIDHACYCHAPTRFIWKPEVYSRSSLPVAAGTFAFISKLSRVLRRIDSLVMQKIPRIATNSRNTAGEILSAYRRSAKVIHPAIRIADYHAGTGERSYYLCVSRLISYKRIDLAVAACKALSRDLLIVGGGPEEASLRTIAGKRTRFLGRISDHKLRELYAGCRGLIFPGHEDFGMAPLEAQAAEAPVIAFGAGGALETVIDGETGVFFRQQTVESLIEAIRKFETLKFDPLAIRSAVERFDVERFKTEIRRFALQQSGSSAL
jgi:glycosyltransferase involved in cell wall biosynthesis